jgi:hypothetical protein
MAKLRSLAIFSAWFYQVSAWSTRHAEVPKACIAVQEAWSKEVQREPVIVTT